MKLRSVAVNQFRKFVEPTRLDGIGDGLNVLIGPNEMGKSTLLDAVSAVFLERHSSNAEQIRALQNDRNRAAPVVHVEFELQDGRYRIEKRFRKKPYARLQCPDGRRLEGGEAEHVLRERLSFETPGPKGAKPETSGIWSVLWVRQGDSWNSSAVPAGARASLHQALEAEVGNVLGGSRGATVVSALVEQLEVLITPRQRRPRNEYGEVLDRVAAAEKELEVLRARRNESGEILDDLDRRRAELVELESKDGVQDKELDSEIDEARTQRDEADRLEERISAAETKAELRARNLDDAKRNLDRRADLRSAVAAAELDVEQVATLRNAAATAVSLEAPPERLSAVTRDDMPLGDDGARFHTLIPTILAIPDWGQITIVPGAHDLDGLGEESTNERLCQRRAELVAAESKQNDSDLEEAVRSARRAYEDQLAIVERLESSQTGDSAADLDARIKSLEETKEERRRNREGLRREIVKLETRVEERHRAGVHEEIGKLERGLEQDKASVAHYKREVEILTLLIETLRAAESAAKKRFVTPILNRVHPHLRALFPGADLEVNEDLSIATIRRDHEHVEKYDQLSLGTREQVAVLVRLAFAQLLAEQGRPAAVILDDSLAFSDDQRLDRLCEILVAVAERVQILVLTCREQPFRRIEARRLHLTPGDSDELASA